MMTDNNLMKQYTDLKNKHPNAIILFRVADYYEIISNDAVTAGDILGIPVTQPNGLKQAGFPFHLLEKHLRTLINAGYSVAIVENN